MFSAELEAYFSLGVKVGILKLRVHFWFFILISSCSSKHAVCFKYLDRKIKLLHKIMIFISSSQQKFNSIIYYYCADTTAIRTITETTRGNKISCQYSRRKLENVSKLITNIILKLKLNLSGGSTKKIKNCKSYFEAEILWIISVSLPMAFAAEGHRAEGKITKIEVRIKI
jgi:hypothetical protein